MRIANDERGVECCATKVTVEFFQRETHPIRTVRKNVLESLVGGAWQSTDFACAGGIAYYLHLLVVMVVVSARLFFMSSILLIPTSTLSSPRPQKIF